jgi:hypothetical protein
LNFRLFIYRETQFSGSWFCAVVREGVPSPPDDGDSDGDSAAL